MPITARIDEFGRPAWLALMILSFIVYWPLGLAVLAFMIWSGRMRMGCGYYGYHSSVADGSDRWEQRWDHKMSRMQEKMDRLRGRMERRGGWGGGFGGGWGSPPSSGNRAFDDYRADTLKRLEEEQREFKEFLDRLRFAKDKTEFDAFMNERRDRGPSEPQPPQTQN